MYAVSRAFVCDCGSDAFIQFHDMRPGLRHRKSITLREHPEFLPLKKQTDVCFEMDSSVCVFVNPSAPPRRCVQVLIELAVMTLINCRGIWLFSVNAIPHAECLVNGCLPVAGQHKPSFSLLLSSPPLLSPPPPFHKRFAVLPQRE